MKERKSQILIEKEGKLMLNKEMKINMVKYKDEDEKLMEEVKEETRKDKERKELEIEQDGFKRFNGLIFIPRSMEGKIIERYHDDVREGHQGETRTAEKIQRYLYFPGMSRKRRNYIRRCDKCQRGKIDTRKPFGLMKDWQHELTRP